MKTISLLLFLLPLFAVGQSDTLISYSNVVPVDSASKTELYGRARHWFENAFKNPKDVISISDKELGELTGSGTMSVPVEYHTALRDGYTPATLTFACSLKFKDGRYRYEFSKFKVVAFGNVDEGYLTSSPVPPENWKYVPKKQRQPLYDALKAAVGAQVKTLIASLVKEMNTTDNF